jgi:hypothetical protein
MVRFYVNGKFAGYGDDYWKNSIPQIGSEFIIYLDKDGRFINGFKEAHIMIVDQIIYNPYIYENDNNTISHGMTNVNIYLVDKSKKSERNNID